VLIFTFKNELEMVTCKCAVQAALTLIVCYVQFDLTTGSRQKDVRVQLNGLLAAFGDFDSDKYTDLFLIDSSLSRFEIHKASADNPYEFQTQLNLTCSAAANQTIVALIPADFHGEAMLDVVVLTKPSNHSDPDAYRLFLIKGNRTALNCSNLTRDRHFAVSRIQPLLLGMTLAVDRSVSYPAIL
jgi:hypothetical protein